MRLGVILTHPVWHLCEEQSPVAHELGYISCPRLLGEVPLEDLKSLAHTGTDSWLLRSVDSCLWGSHFWPGE